MRSFHPDFARGPVMERDGRYGRYEDRHYGGPIRGQASKRYVADTGTGSEYPRTGPIRTRDTDHDTGTGIEYPFSYTHS